MRVSARNYSRGSVTPRPKPVPTRKPHCWLAAGALRSAMTGSIVRCRALAHRHTNPPAADPSLQDRPRTEAPFSLVIMLDGWMVRERGPQWAAPPDCQDAQRVAWYEVKSGVIYRLDHRAET